MARIAGIDLPRNKRTDIGLSYIYGIGRISAQKILNEAGIDGAVRVKDLSEDKIVKLREIIERDYRVEGDLRERSVAEYQAAHRYGDLSRIASSQRPSCPRATNQDQCSDA